MISALSGSTAAEDTFPGSSGSPSSGVIMLKYFVIFPKPYRQELSRPIRINRTAVSGCKAERGDVIALFNLRSYPKTPVAILFAFGQARLIPDSG